MLEVYVHHKHYFWFDPLSRLPQGQSAQQLHLIYQTPLHISVVADPERDYQPQHPIMKSVAEEGLYLMSSQCIARNALA